MSAPLYDIARLARRVELLNRDDQNHGALELHALNSVFGRIGQLSATAGIAHARHELVEHFLGLKVCNWDKTRALAHSEYDDAAGGVCESADRFPYVAGKRRGALLDLDVKIVRAHAP